MEADMGEDMGEDIGEGERRRGGSTSQAMYSAI